LDSKYKTIALVDDEKDTVTLYSIVLQENGYKVMGFTNPLSFLKYIKDHKDEFDLIILDYRTGPM
jgi:DNA-binding NtrC family response regulator